MTGPFVEGFHDAFGPDGVAGWFGTPDETEAPRPWVDPLQAMPHLTLATYIDEVARRHPSLDAAEAALEGAEELFPQVTAFADPQFRFLNGPTLFGSNSGSHLWRLQAQQPLSGWGKRAARGRIAEQKAASAREEWNLAHEKLRIAAAEVYFDYALIEAALPLAEAEQRVAEEEFQGKQIRLVSDEGPAPGEREQLLLDRLELDRRIDEIHWSRQQTIRRVNRLLGRDLNSPLPPPVTPPPVTQVSWDEEELYAEIAARHPALARAEARSREAEARIELARADYYPDFVLVGRFDTNADSFWLPDKAFVRPQLGINAILPFQRDRIAASVREAEAEVRQRRAERQMVERQLREEIAESLAELQRLQRTHQHLASLAELARRKEQSLRQPGRAQFASAADQLQARRQGLKYETERIQAEFAWQRKLFELTGDFSDDGVGR